MDNSREFFVDAADVDAALRSRGVYTYQTLRGLATSTPEFVIDGLLPARSVNLLVGDSNLGKTPLAITAGLAIAAGVPFFNRDVPRARTVLYADTESEPESFARMMRTISEVLGLDVPPERFRVYSPHWDAATPASAADRLLEHVRDLQPDVVIADPLRVLWPAAEMKSDDATRVITQLKQTGKTWLITHHRRKAHMELSVSLEHDPHTWFQEAAGSHALVNQTDARLGVEPARASSNAELILGGFVRSVGPIPPTYIAREYGDDGEPLGYLALTGTELLTEQYRRAWFDLPNTFRFVDAKRALGGNSNSNAKRFLDHCTSLRLATYEDGTYRKCGNRGMCGSEAEVLCTIVPSHNSHISQSSALPAASVGVW